jgi:hypothetical protein
MAAGDISRFLEGETLMEQRQDPLRAYCARLRDTLRLLVEGLEQWQSVSPALRETGLFTLAWRVEAAREVLRMETGRHAQCEWEQLRRFQAEGYVLADWCHRQIYGTPRSPSGAVPTIEEITQALQSIEQLTREEWALHALVQREEEEDALSGD